MSNCASRKICVLLFVLCLGAIFQSPETVDAQGELPITTVISDVISTSDGGFVTAGYRGIDLMTYLYIAKYNSSGSVEWIRDYGEGKSYSDYLKSANFNRIYSLVQTDDGGFALAGTTGSYGAIGYDFWLVKTDSNGKAQWNSTYGGADSDQAYSIIKTYDGGYALAGWTRSFNFNSGLDFYLVKVNSAGAMQWDQVYGGARNEWAYALIQTKDGGYAVAGNTNSYGAGGDTTQSYGYDAWLLKTDSSGKIRWNQTYGNSTGNEVIYSLIETSDGGYVLGGRSSRFYSDDAFMVKADSSGTKLWDLTLSQSGNSEIHAVIEADDGRYVFAGSSAKSTSNLDFLVVKVMTLGALDWSKTYGEEGNEVAKLIVKTNDGGYKVISFKETETNNATLHIVPISSSGVSPKYTDSANHNGNGKKDSLFSNIYLLLAIVIVIAVFVSSGILFFKRKKGFS